MTTSVLTLLDKFFLDIAWEADAPAMSWMPERSQDAIEHLSRAALHDASEDIARGLLQLDWSCDRPRMAILAFSPGLDFIKAFLACQMAGVIAIPIAMPRMGREAHILEAIVSNCGAGVTLTSANETARLQEVFASSAALANMQVISTVHLQELGVGGSLDKRIPQDHAFIQYTSGSSSLPKGVLVSHANLAANLALIQKDFRVDAEFVMVNWLPHYHDMGLIGGLLTPLYGGIPCVSMAPSAFIKRPVRWLQLISAQEEGRKIMSGGPNFAYQLCADRVAAEDIASLQLQAWKTAYNGAEPIRALTLQKFEQRFARAGYRTANMLTCYGLAETTLFATGNHDPAILTVSIQGLEQGLISPPSDEADSRQLVASGHADPERIVIVDALTRTALEPGRIGEIWITGPSVPAQYFNNEEQSRQTFHARLGDQAEPRFLVTGDIGSIVDGQLYVTGRSKELLIVNGRNIYPHDIETMVQNAVSGIEDVAVFSYDDAQAKSESIIVICELPRSARSWFKEGDDQSLSAELDKLANQVRLAVAPAEITIHHLRFVGPMGISKTTSGKTSYGQNRRSFADLPVSIRQRPVSAEFRNKD
ncbi:fatty acyl-AMP ligase [Undibacterium sp. TS12]|uniref:fatty acyl-AMP ligase n=1 Tax=Undibacterium sp. TS12 TaxID=2908202 RepID=UPI001F4C69FC|nr:fatty acyl-AMP ligase [Undibacterium sp. TS12]MCH8621034.1 fatty acyl-AMP ligase [Undibacterium sp. TS12]